jgi:hypothetical protein
LDRNILTIHFVVMILKIMHAYSPSTTTTFESLPASPVE